MSMSPFHLPTWCTPLVLRQLLIYMTVMELIVGFVGWMYQKIEFTASIVSCLAVLLSFRSTVTSPAPLWFFAVIFTLAVGAILTSLSSIPFSIAKYFDDERGILSWLLALTTYQDISRSYFIMYVWVQLSYGRDDIKHERCVNRLMASGGNGIQMVSTNTGLPVLGSVVEGTVESGSSTFSPLASGRETAMMQIDPQTDDHETSRTEPEVEDFEDVEDSLPSLLSPRRPGGSGLTEFQQELDFDNTIAFSTATQPLPQPHSNSSLPALSMSVIRSSANPSEVQGRSPRTSPRATTHGGDPGGFNPHLFRLHSHSPASTTSPTVPRLVLPQQTPMTPTITPRDDPDPFMTSRPSPRPTTGMGHFHPPMASRLHHNGRRHRLNSPHVRFSEPLSYSRSAASSQSSSVTSSPAQHVPLHRRAPTLVGSRSDRGNSHSLAPSPSSTLILSRTQDQELSNFSSGTGTSVCSTTTFEGARIQPETTESCHRFNGQASAYPTSAEEGTSSDGNAVPPFVHLLNIDDANLVWHGRSRFAVDPTATHPQPPPPVIDPSSPSSSCSSPFSSHVTNTTTTTTTHFRPVPSPASPSFPADIHRQPSSVAVPWGMMNPEPSTYEAALRSNTPDSLGAEAHFTEIRDNEAAYHAQSNAPGLHKPSLLPTSSKLTLHDTPGPPPSLATSNSTSPSASQLLSYSVEPAEPEETQFEPPPLLSMAFATAGTPPASPDNRGSPVSLNTNLFQPFV
eukprot:TRINITY_DN51609_c0_g1_i1.p1 TRINITY_DN51609_c0_g1~~TRINITY_DN51609_c0_g1_i1.p1  ORF type:complete len:737 (-),score=20.93 TRINITY_DN51609_c0_g1_i1:131-2341(-)